MKRSKYAENPADVGPGKKRNRSAEIRVLHSRYPELGPAALAKRVGVAPQTVHSVLKRFLADNTEEELQQFQSHKAAAFDAVAMRALGSITEAKLRKASAPSLMMVAGTAHDKSQVLRGLPTGMDVHVLLDLAAIVRGDRGDVTVPAPTKTVTKL
jgi:hypothetical protein